MKRVQRRRTKGWKNPENTIYVGRPTKWGNPFLAGDLGHKEAVERYRECILNSAMVYTWVDEIQATVDYNRFRWISENLSQLKGKNLSCFCSPDKPCHADVLLELANI